MPLSARTQTRAAKEAFSYNYSLLDERKNTRYMKYTLLILLKLFPLLLTAQTANALLQKGWESLVKDQERDALHYFQQAHQQAIAEKNTEVAANALLNIAICYHGTSYTKGLEYCQQAMAAYQVLEKNAPEKALQGRSRCLQLMSTIYGRQGKLRESIALSKEALLGFEAETDSMGYIGLICSSLGTAYGKLNRLDSAEYYNRLSLNAQLRSKNIAYLPTSYLKVGEMELQKGHKTESFELYLRAKNISDSSQNKQAQVSSLLAMGNWYLTFEQNEAKAENYFQQGKQIAMTLSDKSFYISAIRELIKLRKQQGNFEQALDYQMEITHLKDSLSEWETQNIVKRLEVEFEVSEKDRQLRLIQQEKEVALLSNYLLWGGIFVLLLVSTGVILFLRKINRRDKMLLQTKEELMQAVEAQKQLKELHLQNELTFKESQLMAMTLQMVQKNELLQELKTRLEEEKKGENISQSLQKVFQKGLVQDKEWADFDSHFESINKHFYTRLKTLYPDISPNDLKICALIKMNLSIKEMAGILNISPDSVKTARYRLRKKLQLNTEDNLTDFILNIS